MLDRTTRVRSYELAIVARAWLEPTAIQQCGPFKLSGPAAEVLAVILEWPRLVRTAGVRATVDIHASEKRASAFEVAAFADDAERITVADLASLGELRDIITALGSCQRARLSPQKRAA